MKLNEYAGLPWVREFTWVTVWYEHED